MPVGLRPLVALMSRTARVSATIFPSLCLRFYGRNAQTRQTLYRLDPMSLTKSKLLLQSPQALVKQRSSAVWSSCSARPMCRSVASPLGNYVSTASGFASWSRPLTGHQHSSPAWAGPVAHGLVGTEWTWLPLKPWPCRLWAGSGAGRRDRHR